MNIWKRNTEQHIVWKNRVYFFIENEIFFFNKNDDDDDDDDNDDNDNNSSRSQHSEHMPGPILGIL